MTFRIPTNEQIEAVLARKGYENPRFHFIGIRNMETPTFSNAFDDWLLVRAENMGYTAYEATVDPGLDWYEELKGKGGVAVAEPGQYRRAYRIGHHRGYTAFVNQGYTSIGFRRHSVSRDGEPWASPVFRDYIGLNIHRAAPDQLVAKVGRYSAACQVMQDPWWFREVLADAENELDLRRTEGNDDIYFTYTLLTTDDFKDV